MDPIVIVGTGVTPFGKFRNVPLREHCNAALADALADANLTAADVGMVFFGNAAGGVTQGQESIRGQAALRDTGLLGLPIFNVDNACASSTSAVQLAAMAVRSGSCEVALAVGAEKLTHRDRERTFAAFTAAVDQERIDELRRMSADAGTVGDGSIFMDYYALNTLEYIERSGATPEDFADVVVKNRAHGVLNPKAQYRSETTVEAVLDSRDVSGPLKLLMCSPIGDGAAAVVVTTPERAASLGVPAVRIAASALVSGTAEGRPTATQRAAAQAYEASGLGPEDLDVIELHDAAAPAELMTYEELRLCPEGDGPVLLASGATRLGGRLPVNPGGGLIARGHPIGATGCAQIVELADQLRGRCGDRQVPGARVGLAENAGGTIVLDNGVSTVTILTAD
ncbi:MAG: thiolase family protein [Solirubrobacteraceae bacterium]|nr:thiolase family protein [Solirubrobacteraceae bacterium]